MRPLGLLLALTGCSTTATTLEYRPDGTIDLPEPYVQANLETDVPAELLFAIAKAETGFQMVVGESEFPGQEEAYGVMALRGERLAHGAELAGLDIEDAKYDQEANVLAAAWLLAEYAHEEGIDLSDIDQWASVVAYYSGIEDVEGAREYVHYEVYEGLSTGIEVEGYSLAPIAVSPDFPLPERHGARGVDGSTVWTPSPNYNYRSGSPVDFVIIHTCEGSYSGCWSWLSNPWSGVSAHYVVNDNGSEVRALVDENNRAWHIGATYDCGNNSGVECWRNGTSMNTVSVGIEHAGYSSQTSWNSDMIARSAELTCGVTQRHGIPRDSYHIVGHGQLQPWSRSDPGANWPWADYLTKVQESCGDIPAAGGGGGGGGAEPDPGAGGGELGSQIIIDSNNLANETNRFYVDVSASWWGSVSVSGYWNTGYWVAETDSVSDPASFWFELNREQCMRVDAWWPAAWNRPSNITFFGWDEDGREVGRAAVNMQSNGSRWNTLGHWRFEPGWNRVALSRWSTPGYFAVADAVRLTMSDSCD